MRILSEAAVGFVLDLILGDPEKLSAAHPVVLMGRAIRCLESGLRSVFPGTPAGELWAGTCLAGLLTGGTWGSCYCLLRQLRRLNPSLAGIAEIMWCWQALAMKDLRTEAMRVCDALEENDLEAARKAVSRIVGRDTGELTREGVVNAAVETVAENFSDGIVAPLLYMLLGGAPLALCYKAVNTMDSMVGYRNERYLYFGRVPARLDDAANFFPARLSALLLIAAAGICGEDGKRAAQIWKRDRRKHLSPNAAQCESVMAGALGLRLCGPASYFGKRVEKPYIGDGTRTAEPEDIRRACRMEYVGSAAGLLVLGLARWMVSRKV